MYTVYSNETVYSPSVYLVSNEGHVYNGDLQGVTEVPLQTRLPQREGEESRKKAVTKKMFRIGSMSRIDVGNEQYIFEYD